MNLTHKEIKILLSALADAIEDRDSYRDSISKDNKSFPGYEEQYDRTIQLLEQYKTLRRKIEGRKR